MAWTFQDEYPVFHKVEQAEAHFRMEGRRKWANYLQQTWITTEFSWGLLLYLLRDRISSSHFTSIGNNNISQGLPRYGVEALYMEA